MGCAWSRRESQQPIGPARDKRSRRPSPFDYVFLTVKGYDTLDAIEQLSWCYAGTILGSFKWRGNEEAIAAPYRSRRCWPQLTVPVSLDEPARSSCTRGAADWRWPRLT